MPRGDPSTTLEFLCHALQPFSQEKKTGFAHGPRFRRHKLSARVPARSPSRFIRLSTILEAHALVGPQVANLVEGR